MCHTATVDGCESKSSTCVKPPHILKKSPQETPNWVSTALYFFGEHMVCILSISVISHIVCFDYSHDYTTGEVGVGQLSLRGCDNHLKNSQLTIALGLLGYDRHD